MMKKTILFALLMMASVMTAFAQRNTDKLDRGLVAVKTSSGVFCSWRIMGEEYYDVTYNLYRDGSKVNSEPLTVSNYTDAAGTTGSKYTVKAVVRGTEQTASKEATVWSQSYLEITPDHGSLTSTYVPNDACMADVDGDGELEILMKFDNASWAGTSYQKAGYNGEYFIMEVFKLNGKKLWWVDLGPNMADFQNNEQNIVAYDWDGDGKAEAVMRASDGTVIHMADGTEYVIGDKTKNYLAATSSGQWFVHEGSEFLVYMNGETGKPYQVMEYPLKRLEDGETNLEKAWGDGYGHRSTKHFFGAPYLDGRKPSIFLARGIYTRHKMIALDVDPATHQLTERWRWNCSESSSPWYGNGYHNYGIADVDWDGRDEICFGSMVIDDNGKGLSTTGFGHGDAQHHGDFNPYIHGHEIFACMEDNPGNNYRDATTSKIYHRYVSSRDDGRCIAGNFSNDYPGAMGFSGYDNPISCVTADYINGMTKGNIPDNFRIYWDGDLCDEGLNYSNGKNTAIAIYKYNNGTLETLTGSMTNNDTKGTPCYQGDAFGDWREEVIARTADNKIRIYTTTIPTEWRNYTLWHDMQYRNAMVWQMCGYNQPPHVSYFLGELEGITMAPPALTMTNRTEIANGGSIGSAQNDQQVLMAETGDMTVSVSDGAAPYIFFDNAPSWVQGTDVDGTSGKDATINYEYYTHTLTGGAFTGSMRLVKQGDGTLVLPKVTETYTGNTDVWAGTLQFDGTMQASPVWLNRHTSLISNGGDFKGGIKADYNATIYPGGKDNTGTLTTTTLALGFGSRIVFDVNSDGTTDQLTATKLSIEKKDWQYGPEYSTPVFEFNISTNASIPEGKYLIATFTTIEGKFEDVKVEGLDMVKAEILNENGSIYLKVQQLRAPTNTVWNGSENNVWDFGETTNFLTNGQKDIFTVGDQVTFNDQALQTTVIVNGKIAPASVVFANNSKEYTLQGDGSIVGNASLTVTGEGNVNINNVNLMTGGIFLNNGRITAASLANSEGIEVGSLGTLDNKINMNGGTLAIAADATSSQTIVLQENGGTIDVGKYTMNHNGSIERKDATIHGILHKAGTGTLNLGNSNKFGTLYVDGGTVNLQEKNDVINTAENIIFTGNGATVIDPNNTYSYTTNRINYEVKDDASGKLYLDGRCNYYGALTGKGSLTVYATWIRNNLNGNWSNFEGELIANHTGSEYEFTWNNSYGLTKAILNIASGTTFTSKVSTLRVGSLAGSGTLAMPTGNTTNLYVGSDNRDMTFKGTITGKVNVTKEGTGSWTFANATEVNEYFFKNGDIILNNKNVKTSFFGSATANVEGGACLKGMGTVGNIRVYDGGTVEPGTVASTRHYGAITSTGFMYFYPDTKLNLNVYKVLTNDNGRSFLVVSGKLELNGEINIGMGTEYEPKAGDEFIMWKCGSLSGTPTAINLPTLPAGLYWDTSDLMKTTGILRVTDVSTGIKGVSANSTEGGKYYTIDGRGVENPVKKGIYIRNGKKVIIK